MHRCSSGFFLILTVTFLVALIGCLGKSSSNPSLGGIASVSLTPTGIISIDVGSNVVFTPTGRNAGGGAVLGGDIQFSVQSGSPNLPAPLSVASNGNACAGTWNTNVSICSPGTPGIALVTAVINGVSSPPTTVYVHQHVDDIQIMNAAPQPPLYNCFSQGQTWQFTAVAFSHNVDITRTVGPLNWSSSNPAVVTTTPITTGTSQNPVFQVETTAKAPGVARLSANVSGTTSNPFPYTTCLIKAIYLQIGGQDNGGNSITVNAGGSVSVKAIAIDTLYGIANTTPLANPPLTWSTSTPEVAAFTATTNSTGTNNATARSNLGSAALTASCTPPSCNIGIAPSAPVYASNCNVDPLSTPPQPSADACFLPGNIKGYAAISVDVTSASTTTPPTYSAWAGTTGCQGAPGCSSVIFSATPGATPIGPILALPRTPNSLMFNHLAASRLYIGSDEGLMYVDVSGASPSVAAVSNSPTPCHISLCGKVLTISNDGNMVVVSDTVSTPSQVYIFNATASTTSSPIDLIIPGETAIAAAFSPDQLKLFIVTNTGRLYVYSTVYALTSVPIAVSATDVKFSLDGSFAYVAGTPSPNTLAGFDTCGTPTTNILSAITTTYPTRPPLATTPSFALFPLPNQQQDSAGNWTQDVLVLDPPNVDTFGVNVEQHPLLLDQLVCTPPTVALDTLFPKTSVGLGQGNFTPLYAQLAAGGNDFVVVAEKIPAVLVFDVSNGTTRSVPLANSADPLAASGSPDGSNIFVAACDQYDQSTTPPTCAVGSVHMVHPFSDGDFQQVPYVNTSNNNDRNMCNNGGNPAPQCLPNLIAVRPQ